MQRILTLFLILSISISSFAQSTTTPPCDQRETKLRVALGASAAALTYNTYLVVGAISDNYVSKGYTEEKVKSIYDEQKSLLDNVDIQFNKLITDKALIDKDDIYFISEVSSIIKGLKRQMDLFQEYAKDKSDARITTYDNQRKKNWDKIARLLDIPK